MFGISAFAQDPFASLGTSDITRALTGVVAIGDVGFTNSLGLVGVAGSGSVGTVSSEFSIALSGVAASGAVGTVTYSFPGELTGNAAAGAVGTVGMGARTITLTGVQASGAVGTTIAVYWKLIDDSQTANWALVETN